MFGGDPKVIYREECSYREDGYGKPDVYVLDAHCGYNLMYKASAGLSHVKWYQDKSEAIRAATALVDRLNAENCPKPKKPTAEEVGQRLLSMLAGGSLSTTPCGTKDDEED